MSMEQPEIAMNPIEMSEDQLTILANKNYVKNNEEVEKVMRILGLTENMGNGRVNVRIEGQVMVMSTRPEDFGEIIDEQ